MIDPYHLQHYIIEPTLNILALPSQKEAIYLLLGTAAVESDMGYSLHQNKGPALGIYQIEPITHKCIWDNFLLYRPLLKEKVLRLLIPSLTGEDNLIGNLYYATAIARMKYFRSSRKLPAYDDIVGQAKMWRYDYNSIEGAFDNEVAQQKYIEKFNKYIRPILND